MKFFLLVFFIANINNVFFADLLNPSKFIQIVDSKNNDKSIEFFSNIKKISLEEIKTFVEDFFAIIIYKHDIQDLSAKRLQDFILSYFDQSQMDEKTLNEVKLCLVLLMDELTKNELKKKLINVPIFSKQEFYITKCKSSKKNDKELKEIPGGIVIGCTETLCGALLWVTPFRSLGLILMGDGIRRMLNETEEQAKKNEKQRIPQ